MSLSDYATSIVNLKGESIEGGFKFPEGVKVEIYKTRLQIHHPKGYIKKGASFIKPIVMGINSGSATYHSVHVEAVRGPQSDRVYMAAWHTSYKRNKLTRKVTLRTTGMVGIGCYGFLDSNKIVLEKLGRPITNLNDWVGGVNIEVSGKEVHFIENFKTREIIKHDKIELRDMWVGVQQSDIEALKKFLIDNENLPEEVRKVDLSRLVPYNQGTAFLASHIK